MKATTFAQESILKRIDEKKVSKEVFQDHEQHTDYEAYSEDYNQYDDYNDNW